MVLSNLTRRAISVANGMRQSAKRKLAVGASGLLMLVSTLVMTSATPAHAYAYTCAGYGYGYSTYRSQFCAETNGSGLYAKTLGAGFSAPVAWAGTLCNTRVRVEFIDSWGHQWRPALVSGQQNGCSAVGAWKWNWYQYLRAGTLRYVLLSNGATIVTVEHRIS